ncbi:MAG: hypothetical protein B6U95_00060 [Thermofilum sp. ex4484_82]|nr:MAG: hypothetical protein B6U95_00060 [Thermofilum sp. ex4484_82]OYT40123.1 MAG: hypothetical protein B6U96_00060 [Archaeoglobales archaeon ex4484_92]
MKKIGLEELEKLMEEKAGEGAWARIVGFYRKLKSDELTAKERWHILCLFGRNLLKRGFQLDSEVVVALLEGKIKKGGK